MKEYVSSLSIKNFSYSQWATNLGQSVIAFSAGEMGAEHKFDLTSDVTHLIVGGIDSSKYKYVARERPDVKVVLPAFIDAVKESWIEGGATDVAALEEQYRVPTFNGLIICVTGIESCGYPSSLCTYEY